MTNTYTRIPATEATAGDEVLLNGEWHKVKTVGRVGSSVVLIFPSGGRISGPTHVYTMRREVAALATVVEAPARCENHPSFDADYCPLCGTARVIGKGI